MNTDYQDKPLRNIAEMSVQAENVVALLKPGMTSGDALSVFRNLESIRTNLQTTMAYLPYRGDEAT